MIKQDYTASITISSTPQDAFNSINNVAAWWTADFEGRNEKIDNIFTVHFGEVFITINVIELIANKKIVWYVLDCNKPWLKNKKEWNGTKLSWEILEENNKTKINFTHIGLVPEIECYNACEGAWNKYINMSLFKLITEGKGIPS